MKRSTAATILGIVTCLTAGCGVQDDGVGTEVAALAQDSGEASTATDQAAALLSVPLQSISNASQLASPEAAASAAATAPTFLQPAGCVVVTKGPTTVSYELQGCTGPLGLVRVSGKLVATFSPVSIGTVKVTVKSEGLVIGAIPVTLVAQGSISYAGTTRQLSWTATYEGTSASGRALTHEGSYAGSFDQTSGCLALDGSASTKLGAWGVDTATQGYQRCNGCPTAGTVTATGQVSKLSISVTYLGSGHAELKVPSGKVYPYTMGWCL